MKRIFSAFILTILMLVFLPQIIYAESETTVKSTEQIKLPDVKLYINDELTQSAVYENQESSLSESTKDFIPLRSSLEAMGCSVEWQEPNNIIIKTPRDSNIYMRVWEKKIDYRVFWKDDYSFLDEVWSPARVGMSYINVNGSIYYPLREFPNIVACYIYRDGNSIYLDSAKYYKEKHNVYENIGRKVNVTAYMNDIKIDTPVYYNMTEAKVEGNTLGYFVELRPVFETIGAEVEFIPPNIIKIKRDDLNYYTFRAKKVYGNGEENLYDNGDEDCYIVNGKTYIGFSRIRYCIDGSLNQKDVHNMYLYTNDFVRKDIPATLQEAYKYFDEHLYEEDIEFLRNCSDDELSLTHFGLGLWIRNKWIYPADDRIAKVFLDKGITHPDNMSSLIIKGYKLYLNNLPCEIDDLL